MTEELKADIVELRRIEQHFNARLSRPRRFTRITPDLAMHYADAVYRARKIVNALDHEASRRPLQLSSDNGESDPRASVD